MYVCMYICICAYMCIHIIYISVFNCKAATNLLMQLKVIGIRFQFDSFVFYKYTYTRFANKVIDILPINFI